MQKDNIYPGSVGALTASGSKIIAPKGISDGGAAMAGGPLMAASLNPRNQAQLSEQGTRQVF
jgi:hypothetical protein